MSYDIYIVHPETGKVMELNSKHQIKGGIYEVGGTNEAYLNITYNYAPYFYNTIGGNGIRTLYGMKVSDSISIIENAISKLGDDITDNYWDATEGHAKKSLKDLLELAHLFPEGIWDGD